MWGHLFFFFVLRDCVRWLAHSLWPNAIILLNIMASSVRWTVFEPFAPLSLADHRHRSGMLSVHPLPDPADRQIGTAVASQSATARKGAQTLTGGNKERRGRVSRRKAAATPRHGRQHAE